LNTISYGDIKIYLPKIRCLNLWKWYVSNRKATKHYDYNKNLVEYAKAMGKSGVAIIADKGAFPFKHRIDKPCKF
jgi:hypothetical protein